MHMSDDKQNKEKIIYS